MGSDWEIELAESQDHEFRMAERERQKRAAEDALREIQQLRHDLEQANKRIRILSTETEHGRKLDAALDVLATKAREYETMRAELEIATKLYAKARKIGIDEAADNIRDARLNREEKP